MGKNKLQYCECCKNIAFQKHATRKYCKNCGRHIGFILNKANQKRYREIRALKKKPRKNKKKILPW